MNPSVKNSIEYKGSVINFSFNTGALKLMRDLGYDIDYNNVLASIKDYGTFCADFLFCCAKFYARKDSTFAYDQDDAHDWIPIFGGLESVVSALTMSINGGIMPIQVADPNGNKTKDSGKK